MTTMYVLNFLFLFIQKKIWWKIRGIISYPEWLTPAEFRGQVSIHTFRFYNAIFISKSSLTISYLLSSFMAYTFLVDLCRTNWTSPKAPRPITFMTLKSFGFIRSVDRVSQLCPSKTIRWRKTSLVKRINLLSGGALFFTYLTHHL